MACKPFINYFFTPLTGSSLVGSDGCIVSWTISVTVSQGVSGKL